MKALSIRQPWAWCILRPDLGNVQNALGVHRRLEVAAARRAAEERGEIKDVENRDWHTTYRGGFFVHAGKVVDEDAYEWIAERFPDLKVPPPEELERGGIVGRAILSDVVKHHSSRWFVGEFGFVLAAAEPLPLHPCPGALGWFDVPGFTRPKIEPAHRSVDAPLPES